MKELTSSWNCISFIYRVPFSLLIALIYSGNRSKNKSPKNLIVFKILSLPDSVLTSIPLKFARFLCKVK